MGRGRKKSVTEFQTVNEDRLLALPPPRVVTGGHHREHQRDPYETPAGAVPAKATNTRVTSTRPKKTMSGADIAARDEARELARMQGARYLRYLDLLQASAGDKIGALSAVFGLSRDETEARQVELRVEVRRGIGSTDIADVLEQNDLGVVERAAMLRKWMYSNEAGPSLKAIDMINELEGGAGTAGSFESYLRLAKQQER